MPRLWGEITKFSFVAAKVREIREEGQWSVRLLQRSRLQFYLYPMSWLVSLFVVMGISARC